MACKTSFKRQNDFAQIIFTQVEYEYQDISPRTV